MLTTHLSGFFIFGLDSDVTRHPFYILTGNKLNSSCFSTGGLHTEPLDVIDYCENPCPWKIQVISHEMSFAWGFHSVCSLKKFLCKSDCVGYNLYPLWTWYLTFVLAMLFYPPPLSQWSIQAIFYITIFHFFAKPVPVSDRIDSTLITWELYSLKLRQMPLWMMTKINPCRKHIRYFHKIRTVCLIKFTFVRTT